eukprot:TRINITY_DN1438_c0_g1_i3.p1 TRINITY_DN1438_c0_g1~~TRINITY_DN1438_c0_g1_i3.p1  ORF type:complete len:146 (+),score=23.38 TRINITY_DN1438_c0_g1_i3:244-681(+)
MESWQGVRKVQGSGAVTHSRGMFTFAMSHSACTSASSSAGQAGMRVHSVSLVATSQTYAQLLLPGCWVPSVYVTPSIRHAFGVQPEGLVLGSHQRWPSLLSSATQLPSMLQLVGVAAAAPAAGLQIPSQVPTGVGSLGKRHVPLM